MPRGGKRPGAGRPKGSKEPKTLEKEAARQVLRARVFASMEPMVDAQIKNALGIKYLVSRDRKTGKFTKLTEEQAKQRLATDSDAEIIEIWEERPNVQAFTDLMNRTIDKPAEQVDLNANINVNRADRVLAARGRVGKR